MSLEDMKAKDKLSDAVTVVQDVLEKEYKTLRWVLASPDTDSFLNGFDAYQADYNIARLFKLLESHFEFLEEVEKQVREAKGFGRALTAEEVADWVSPSNDLYSPLREKLISELEKQKEKQMEQV